MSRRKQHQKKEVAKAIKYAESKGWRFEESNSSSIAGTLKCPEPGGCKFFVFCTPRDQDDHAKDIRRQVDRCTHAEQEPTP